MKENPTVFISYSHDSKEHQDRVLVLSNKLRTEGIDCSLDQYEDSPPEGWPKWMDRQVRNSDFILIVCTEKYYKRAMGDDEKGMGIKWESSLIYQHLYNAGSNNTKFIPVLFDDGLFDHIPEPLQGATFYNVDNSDDYDKLYWRLRRVVSKKPQLGKLRELPVKERKTLFVSGLIDHELWDRANWRNGVFYLYNDGKELPPIFTVLFDNLELGQEIFKELINKLSDEDENERLRLSIVEGDVPNQEPGYFVTIGENIDATYKLFESKDQHELVALSQRIHRVVLKGKSTSKSLAMFKTEYDKFGCYYIVPAKQTYHPEQGYGCEVDLNYAIFKKQIEFRNYKDVQSQNDPDSILKTEEVLNHKF